MSAMYRIKKFTKKLFSPVSIMLIPHDCKRTINVKIPSVFLFISIMLCLAGSFYLGSMAVDAIEYQRMKQMVDNYNAQFTELKPTILMLKKAEAEFRSLMSRGGGKDILRNIADKNGADDAGSLDIDNLKDEIRKTAESVASVREFLKRQWDEYLATPIGWPVDGRITSGFGNRQNPRGSGTQFHSGIDISTPSGSPVRATADGVVSISKWHPGSGNIVVIEHGMGYTTLYAHNTSNIVNVGQEVKRGDIIAYSGSTGNSTGPHVHYEVWKNNKPMNPKDFLEVQKK